MLGYGLVPAGATALFLFMVKAIRTLPPVASFSQDSWIVSTALYHDQLGLLNSARNLRKSFSEWDRRVVVLAREASSFIKNSVLSGALSENSSGFRLVTIPLWVWYTMGLGQSFFWFESINNNRVELNNIISGLFNALPVESCKP